MQLLFWISTLLFMMLCILNNCCLSICILCVICNCILSTGECQK